MMASLVVLAALALQDSRPPEFVMFDVARERVGHRVVVEAALENRAATEISGLQVTAIYYDGNRELRRSGPVPIPRIAPGATASFRIDTPQVPNFSRCDLYVVTPGLTYAYAWTGDAGLPSLRPATAPRLLLASHILSPLVLVVRNAGGSPADEPTATLTFREAGGAMVQQVRLRLERSMAPASQDTFEVTVPGVAPYASVDVTLAWQASDEILLADSPDSLVGLQLRQCGAVRLTDGSVRIRGVLANGTPEPMRHVEARFHLGRHEASYKAPGVLRPGESRSFVFYVPSCPPFEMLAFALSCEAASADTVPAEPPGPSSRRTSSRRVEADRITLPPPPQGAPEAAAPAEARPPSVGIRGLLVSEGSYGKEGRHSGDVYLMRMIFLDEKARPFQPEASISFTLYDGDHRFKTAHRNATRQSWNTDATRIALQLDTVACDRKTGELWVGILWADRPWKTPRADVTVKIKDVGTYTLKGVEKDWDFTPQWPDRTPSK